MVQGFLNINGSVSDYSSNLIHNNILSTTNIDGHIIVATETSFSGQLVSGQTVVINDALNTSLNNIFTVTVLSDTTFSVSINIGASCGAGGAVTYYGGVVSALNLTYNADTTIYFPRYNSVNTLDAPSVTSITINLNAASNSSTLNYIFGNETNVSYIDCPVTIILNTLTHTNTRINLNFVGQCEFRGGLDIVYISPKSLSNYHVNLGISGTSAILNCATTDLNKPSFNIYGRINLIAPVIAAVARCYFGESIVTGSRINAYVRVNSLVINYNMVSASPSTPCFNIIYDSYLLTHINNQSIEYSLTFDNGEAKYITDPETYISAPGNTLHYNVIFDIDSGSFTSNDNSNNNNYICIDSAFANNSNILTNLCVMKNITLDFTSQQDIAVKNNISYRAFNISVHHNMVASIRNLQITAINNSSNILYLNATVVNYPITSTGTLNFDDTVDLYPYSSGNAGFVNITGGSLTGTPKIYPNYDETYNLSTNGTSTGVDPFNTVQNFIYVFNTVNNPVYTLNGPFTKNMVFKVLQDSQFATNTEFSKGVDIFVADAATALFDTPLINCSCGHDYVNISGCGSVTLESPVFTLSNVNMTHLIKLGSFNNHSRNNLTIVGGTVNKTSSSFKYGIESYIVGNRTINIDLFPLDDATSNTVYWPTLEFTCNNTPFTSLNGYVAYSWDISSNLCLQRNSTDGITHCSNSITNYNYVLAPGKLQNNTTLTGTLAVTDNTLITDSSNGLLDTIFNSSMYNNSYFGSFCGSNVHTISNLTSTHRKAILHVDFASANNLYLGNTDVSLSLTAVSSPVNNGGFTSDVEWIKGSGWTISDDLANCASHSGTTSISQTCLVQSCTYTVQYTVVRVSGSINVELCGTSGTSRSTSGTFTETIVSGTTGFDISFNANSSFVGTIDNVSVIKNITYVSSTYEITDNTDVPKILLTTAASPTYVYNMLQDTVNGRIYVHFKDSENNNSGFVLKMYLFPDTRTNSEDTDVLTVDDIHYLGPHNTSSLLSYQSAYSCNTYLTYEQYIDPTYNTPVGHEQLVQSINGGSSCDSFKIYEISGVSTYFTHGLLLINAYAWYDYTKAQLIGNTASTAKSQLGTDSTNIIYVNSTPNSTPYPLISLNPSDLWHASGTAVYETENTTEVGTYVPSTTYEGITVTYQLNFYVKMILDAESGHSITFTPTNNNYIYELTNNTTDATLTVTDNIFTLSYLDSNINLSGDPARAVSLSLTVTNKYPLNHMDNGSPTYVFNDVQTISFTLVEHNNLINFPNDDLNSTELRTSTYSTNFRLPAVLLVGIDNNSIQDIDISSMSATNSINFNFSRSSHGGRNKTITVKTLGVSTSSVPVVVTTNVVKSKDIMGDVEMVPDCESPNFSFANNSYSYSRVIRVPEANEIWGSESYYTVSFPNIHVGLTSYYPEQSTAIYVLTTTEIELDDATNLAHVLNLDVAIGTQSATSIHADTGSIYTGTPASNEWNYPNAITIEPTNYSYQISLTAGLGSVPYINGNDNTIRIHYVFYDGVKDDVHLLTPGSGFNIYEHSNKTCSRSSVVLNGTDNKTLYLFNDNIVNLLVYYYFSCNGSTDFSGLVNSSNLIQLLNLNYEYAPTTVYSPATHTLNIGNWILKSDENGNLLIEYYITNGVRAGYYMFPITNIENRMTGYIEI